jgi:AraC-like DNA-binding protein
VIFAAPEDALVFDASIRDLPLVTADAELHAALEQRTEAILAALPGNRFVQRARIAVVRSLRAGTGASLPALAALLEASERTIQRRLREGGTTHTELVDSVRHELAVRWMADGLGTPEIACLLGFSDATVFHRAFKRWTGSTIAQERARIRK